MGALAPLIADDQELFISIILSQEVGLTADEKMVLEQYYSLDGMPEKTQKEIKVIFKDKDIKASPITIQANAEKKLKDG